MRNRQAGSARRTALRPLDLKSHSNDKADATMTLLSHADYERIAANLSYPTEAFIGGTFAPALSGETMPPVTPATGK